MVQTQNKNKKNPTHEKPVPAAVLPNNLDTGTKAFSKLNKIYKKKISKGKKHEKRKQPQEKSSTSGKKLN
jgi:hypothetical protein